MKIFKLVISTIVEVIASPFTLLFRTKAQKNSGNKVNIFLVVLYLNMIYFSVAVQTATDLLY